MCFGTDPTWWPQRSYTWNCALCPLFVNFRTSLDKGVFFFDTNVNHTAYLNMLQTLFVPQLREISLEATALLKQDGAPVYYALQVTKVSWRQIEWTMDLPRIWYSVAASKSRLNSIWQFALRHCENPSKTVEDLKAAMRDCFNNFQPSIGKCLEKHGGKLILSRMRGLRDEYNGLWIGWLDLLARWLPLQPITCTTAHN
jgi:hypothetical protein